MSQAGVGVLLGILGGNKETVDAINACLGKRITRCLLDQESDTLKIEFEGKIGLMIHDAGQSCCEHRYMRTDDNLSEYVGAVLLDLELKDAPDMVDEYGDHEVRFLDVKTDKGVFQLANHNEHNGYYGGFWIVASNYTVL